MATTVGLRKILDLKRWEACAPYAFNLLATGGTYSPASTLFDQFVMAFRSAGGAWHLYDPREDSFVPIPTPGTSPTDSSAAVAYHPSGPTGTASAGTASTLTTATNLPGSLAGYTVRITGGTGAGQERVIASNTSGAAAVLTVGSNWSVTPDNTSVYLLITGRFWLLSGQTSPSFQYYDVATNAWSSALSITGLTAVSGVQWHVTSTPAYGSATATGTATSATSTTLTNSGKAWAASQWVSYQVRITGGTGAGQVRTITANTGTQLTVAAWSATPDATSTYSIEPNDDYIYATSTTALFRYSISGNTWSTLSPGVARTTAPTTGSQLNWIAVASDASWADETSIKNGRYIYSWSGSNLAVYDIAANTWINTQTAYLRGSSNFTTSVIGCSQSVDREFVYLVNPVSSTQGTYPVVHRFNCVTNTLDAFSTPPLPGPGFNPATSPRTAIVVYNDGGTTLRWLYWAATPTAGLVRILIF